MRLSIWKQSSAILSGGLFFSGVVSGVEVIANGSFENGSPTGWPAGFSSYNHTGDVYYSGPALNSADEPNAGSNYSWNNLGTQVISDLGTAAGISTTSIDGGGAEFTLSSWLSGYSPNPEFSGIELKFFDTVGSGGTQVGATVSFDGDDEGGLYNAGWSGSGPRPEADTDRNTWTFYRMPGSVPVGARRAEVRIFNSGGLSGSPDTYVDVVSLDIVDKYIPGQPSGLEAELNEETEQVVLNWNTPASPFVADQVIIFRDVVQLAVLPATAVSFVDAPPLSSTLPQTVNYVLRFTNAGATEIELTTSVDWVPDNLSGELVAYYRFEDGFRDTSGSAKSHDGVSAGNANIMGDGVYGHALELRDQSNPADALVLGNDSDFDFGAGTDFSISLWFRRLGPMENNASLGGSPLDAAIISDKNWSSGSNVGWGIFATSDGGVKWNMSDGSTRLDTTIVGGFGSDGVADGQWHHLVVTHDRDGLARFFLDGKERGTKSISGLGAIDTGLPLTLGADGLSKYPWGGDIDEVAIWRRVLVEEEVVRLCEVKNTGESVTGASIIDSDGDGMDDAWEQMNFGTLAQDADDDMDGDRQSNFEEYAMGTSPTNGLPNSFEVSQTEFGGQSFPLISYERPSLNRDVSYHVEYSGDLVLWQSGDDLFVPAGAPVDLGQGLQRVESRFYQTTESEQKHFFRVRMESRYQAAYAGTIEPTVEFENGSAIIRWKTDEPTVTVLNFGRDGEADGRYEDYALRTQHEVVIPGIDPGEVLAYTAIVLDDGVETRSRTFTTSRAWDYTAPPVPDQAGYVTVGGWVGQAAGVLALPEVNGRGYCLDLRCGDGRLAFELVRQSRLVVVAVEDTEAEVEAARQFLTERGVYGSRVTVVHASDLGDLPFEEGTFNLVVSQEQADTGSNFVSLVNEAQDLVVPTSGVVAGLDGGVWVPSIRGDLSGTDDWTMQYGGPGNKGANEEELGGKTSIPEFDLKWLGRPGPEIVIDRMVRAPSPLSAGGQFYCQGMGRVLALDAHNGSIMWSLEVDQVRRLNMIRDASNMAASEEGLYLAVRGECWRLAAEDGAREVYPVVDGPRADFDYSWGYVSRVGDQLLGSATKADAFYQKYWGQDFWFDAQSGDQTYQVCSDNLYSLDANTGMLNWKYERGLILNVTIAAGDGKIFFLECNDVAEKSSDSRRLSAAAWKKSLHLVCLDFATGNVLWDVAPSLTGGEPCMWLQYANGRVLVTGSEQSNDSFNLHCFDAADGALVWNQSHGWKSSHHGGNHQHPVISNGSVYLEPHRYALSTGVRTGNNIMPGRNGCSTFRGAKDVMFYRGLGMSGQYAGNVAMWDPAGGTSSAISRVRPGCWLSYVPASGTILVQEQGAGCSCGSWMETSFGLMPKR